MNRFQTGRHSLTALLRERVSLAAGDEVSVILDPAHIHLFDTATGNRIG